jgi:hypothetical protein
MPLDHYVTLGRSGLRVSPLWHRSTARRRPYSNAWWFLPPNTDG